MYRTFNQLKHIQESIAAKIKTSGQEGAKEVYNLFFGILPCKFNSRLLVEKVFGVIVLAYKNQKQLPFRLYTFWLILCPVLTPINPCIC